MSKTKNMQHNITPLTLAHEVKENILGYLKTTYNINNQNFSTALETFLQKNLCHPPYIDIKLPFKIAQTNTPDIDLKLPFTPYEHQIQAMQKKKDYPAKINYHTIPSSPQAQDQVNQNVSSSPSSTIAYDNTIYAASKLYSSTP